MDAVKYFQEKRRMLNSLGRIDGICMGVNCSRCPLSGENNGTKLTCRYFEAEYPEEAVAIIEKWATEHQQKTMLQDFLEKYPNVALADDGTPFGLCPNRLGFTEYDGCRGGKVNKCINCWNRPIEG